MLLFLFNDSAHSKRNHKRNFPSFSLPKFPNTISHVTFFVWFIICFCSTEEKEWPATKQNLFFIFFEEFFFTVLLGYQTIIKFIFENTHILCVWKSYIIRFIFFFHWNSFVSLFFSAIFAVSLAVAFCWWLSNF